MTAPRGGAPAQRPSRTVSGCTKSESADDMRKTTTLATTLTIAALIGLSACGQDKGQDSAPEETKSAQVSADAAVSLDDAWVKAGQDGMTAVFGSLKNNTDKDVTVVEAKYDNADMVQLHETVEDSSGGTSMQEKKGGFTIPAEHSLNLEPGGDHIMIMGLSKPIKPGEEISLDLVTADRQSITVTAVAKDYSGAKESYGPDEAASDGSTTGSKESDHDEMDHDDMSHEDHGDH